MVSRDSLLVSLTGQPEGTCSIHPSLSEVVLMSIYEFMMVTIGIADLFIRIYSLTHKK